MFHVFIHQILSSQPTSVVEEEVSEESSFIVTRNCTCQHEDGCAVATLGGPVQGRNGGSIEVWDRLRELQRRNSELEQEKVGTTKMWSN